MAFGVVSDLTMQDARQENKRLRKVIRKLRQELQEARKARLKRPVPGRGHWLTCGGTNWCSGGPNCANSPR